MIKLKGLLLAIALMAFTQSCQSKVSNFEFKQSDAVVTDPTPSPSASVCTPD